MVKLKFLLTLFIVFVVFKRVFAAKNPQSVFNTDIKLDSISQPNIIFILVDDLGIGDIGVFFQNQRKAANNRHQPFTLTPYLDKMAENGAMMEHYCPAPVCAPSRASLLLGQSQGHANIRDNQFDKALANNYTIGNVLQKAGYHTAAIGKWGLQGLKTGDGDWEAHPYQRGFDYYLGYISHKAGHEHYPKEGIYRGKQELYFGHKNITEDLDKSYTADLFTANAKKYIIEQVKSKKSPFFLFLAYDTPHAVMELPTQAYPKGFGLKGGLQWLGKPGKMINTASGTVDSYIDPAYEKATYDDDNDSTTPEIKWPETYKRFATITKRMDNHIHDILILLNDLKIAENTLVIFTSDNGPSNESYLPKNFVNNNPTFFGSTAQFDGIKRDIWEGGIRVPTIAYWPNHIAAGKNIIIPSIMYDWLPTFSELAGLKAPIISDGTSLVPALLNKGKQKNSYIYIEYHNKSKTPNYNAFDISHRGRIRNQMQMIRIADTVAIRYDIKTAKDDFEIYDIRKDPQQINNLAKGQDLLNYQKLLKDKVLKLRKPNSSAKRPYDHELIRANKVEKLKKGLNRYCYNNSTEWISDIPEDSLVPEIKQKFDLSKNEQNAILFKGYIQVKEDGFYDFSLQTNGKAFLRIHDIALIDEDFDYKNEIKSARLNLEKGFHKFKLYYFDKNQVIQPKLDFKWAKSGNEKVAIDSSIYIKN